MEKISTIRRRPKASLNKTEEKKKETQREEETKVHKDNGEASITVKLESLPEVKYAEGKKQIMLSIRTPQLGFLQFFLKAKTYRRYRQMILDLDEEQDYQLTIKAPSLRLEKRSGTPTCYGCEIQLKLKKKKEMN